MEKLDSVGLWKRKLGFESKRENYNIFKLLDESKKVKVDNEKFLEREIICDPFYENFIIWILNIIRIFSCLYFLAYSL